MRHLYTIFIFFLLVSGPFWLYIPAILVGAIIFPMYIEAMFFGVFIDAIYGSSFVYSFAAAALVYFAVPLRERLRFNV